MTCEECTKNIGNAQAIRLVDVFFIGPVLVAAAFIPKIPVWLRWIVGIIGIATIAYNGYWYFRYKNL